MFSRLTASTWKFSCSDLQTADCLLIVGECAGGSKGMPALLISPSRVWPFMRDLTSPAALWTAASSVTSKSSGVKKSPNSPCSRFASASFLTLWWQLHSQERGNPHLTNNTEGASFWYRNQLGVKSAPAKDVALVLDQRFGKPIPEDTPVTTTTRSMFTMTPRLAPGSSSYLDRSQPASSQFSCSWADVNNTNA